MASLGTWPLAGAPARVSSVEATPKPRQRKPRKAPRPTPTSRLHNLTLDVYDLQRELADLTRHRELLRLRMSYLPREPATSVLEQVATYFHGFQRGYYREDFRQQAFVHALADDALTMGTTGLGVEMLLEQWRRYTELFRMRELVLHSSEIVANADENAVVVRCHATFHGVFTRAAISTVFPGAGQDLWLMMRVLGQEMVFPLTFHLYFNARGRLHRHDVVADFCAAVRCVLGDDVSAVAQFMAGARVGEESTVGRLDRIEMVSDEADNREREAPVVAVVEEAADATGRGETAALGERGEISTENSSQGLEDRGREIDRSSIAFLLAPM